MQTVGPAVSLVFDQLNNFINSSEMAIPSSHYWNVSYGTEPGEVTQDAEVMQIMSVLGQIMAGLLYIMPAGASVIKHQRGKKRLL